MSLVSDAVGEGTLPGRVWLYSNFHCNLACEYCLTASSPTAPRRELGRERMLAIARQAKALGFTRLGVTGGEPFLLPWMVDFLVEVSEILPVVVLSNGTLFAGRLLERMRRLVGRDVAVQISLDHPDPGDNDALRAPGNHARVLDAVRALVEMGLRVRIASTVEHLGDAERARLVALVRALGVADEDHLLRPVVRRGRAAQLGMGVVAGPCDLPAELCIAADGAYYSGFGPTWTNGHPDTDLLLTRTILPLRRPAEALLGVIRATPPGDDAHLGIR